MINTIMYSWKRPLKGREQLSATHFEEFADFLSGLQRDGEIQSFDTVLLHPNNLLNGFFLIRGEDEQLSRLLDSEAWEQHIVRSLMHLHEPVLSYGVCGQMARQAMARWVAAIPK